jgi:hydroxymethylpyrimidine/phosphomethylpyrimidine kinase
MVPALPPVALSIGGSDSAGSAGIQADLKTFTTCQVYGTTVLTTLTAQNTQGVQRNYPVPVDFVQAQLDAVVSDISIHAAKTGFLGRAEVVKAIAHEVITWKFPLVVDPVLVNGQGQLIVDADTQKAYREKLFPQATLITPNGDEAVLLSGLSQIRSHKDMREAARRLHALGPRYVLLKGGHLAEKSQADTIIDVLFDGQEFYELPTPRLPIHNPHGVGCTLSAAITAHLAQGLSMLEAVQRGQAYLIKTLEGALQWRVGRGRSPVNHFAP